MTAPVLQRITIRPSGILTLCLGAAHCGAAAVVWATPAPILLNVVLTAVIGTSLAWNLLGRALLRTCQAIVALEIRGSGSVSFRTRRGRWTRCELLGTSFVSSWITVLNVRPAGQSLARHVILVPDNVDRQDFRRLRVWLRWFRRGDPGRVG